MQTELLDITIIGCLVLLFWSAYRKRRSAMVRAWMAGWILIVVHFAAAAFHPAQPALALTLSIISLTALVACGIVFLLAVPQWQDRRSKVIAFPTLAGAAAIGYVVLVSVMSAPDHAACYLMVLVGAACWIAYALELNELSHVTCACLLVAIAGSTGWLLWAIAHSHYDIGMYAMLAQVYTMVGITYIGAMRRISAGTMTVALSLIAWAAVFPVAEFCTHLGIVERISPELWNIPKYFVAFGMMLLLLEEEILGANEANETLFFQAHHDQLTGLRNRASLERTLEECVDEARMASRRCALIALDVDRFKHINDTYGHVIGDVCLMTLASRIASVVDNPSMIARVGGEEFGVVVRQISGAAEAQSLARRLQRAISEPVAGDGYLFEVTASIGVAVFPDDGDNADTLWRNADCAMYGAKRAGGNQVISMSPEILKRASEENQMERFLRTALQEGHLELAYQPIFTKEGEMHSLEALVRLRHPVLGVIGPDRFIPVAEERGLIVPLGEWVLNEVCAQISRWRDAGLRLLPVAVNVSAVQITAPAFAATVAGVFAKHGVEPSLMAMEITETAMMRNLAEASRQIQLLAAGGVVFSVDDFGMGYSSLAQLDSLDVHCLKIDRTFVARICDFGETHSIVAAIISMAHSLNLKVVAEGVESQEQLQRLHALNCDFVQGYLFGRPFTAEQAERILLQETNATAADILQASS